MSFLLGCLFAYLLGGVPFSLLLVRLLAGVDLRTIGSGNVGATNASRAFEKPWRLPVFLAVYLLDTAKGFVPAWWFAAWFGGPGAAPVVYGACAIVGHCASPYLRFRGGKGVATATGVMLALDPFALLCGLAAFFAVLGLTRQVFLGSLALGVALAAAIVLRDPATAFGARLPVTVFGLAVMLLLFFTHRGNLRKMVRR